jgi:hypothetical protein
MLSLVGQLNVLNRELIDLDAQIKKVLDDTPKPKNIVEEMTLDKELSPLRERCDLLKLRFVRQGENVFDSLITKGGG